MFKRALLISLPLLCTACGTFQLANNIQPPPGKTSDQQQSDILVCKDQAKMAASTAGKQAEGFLLGMTIVGAPVAYEEDKKTQRETFAQCMRAKGYTLQIADDRSKPVMPAPAHAPQVQQSQAQQPQQTQTAQATTKEENPSTNTENSPASRLEALKKLKDGGLISQSDYDSKKKEILNSM